jgi:hypothetical protein
MPRRPPKTIHIKVRSLKEAAEFIGDLPRFYRGAFVRGVAESLVEDLRFEPPYQHVTRLAAYGMQAGGPGFFSDRQRRFVMASLRAGHNLKTGSPFEPGFPHRTGNSVGRPGQAIDQGPGFHVEQKGAKTVIVNTSPGAAWIVNDYWQARQPAMVGWKKSGVTIQENIEDAMFDGFEYVMNEIERRK